LKNIILVTAVLFYSTVFCQPGKVEVNTWAGNKKAAFSFTFDDSFISHYTTVRPILNQYGFKGTFYLISGYITETLPGIWRYGTWEMFREMAAEGHEMGSHTVTHPDLNELLEGDIYTEKTLHYELYNSKIQIRQNIPGAEVITLAYPFTHHNSLVDQITNMYYEAGRAGGAVPNNSSLTGTERMSVTSKSENFNTPRTSTADDEDEWQDFKTYLEKTVAKNGWGTLMAHEVYPFSEIPYAVEIGAYYPMSSEWLTKLCDYLKEKSDSGSIWVETAANVLKYMRERESFNSVVINSTDTLIEISVTDNMDDAIYNYPLSAKITVPADWDAVIVTQNGASTLLIPVVNSIEAYVSAQVIPDNGNITLLKKVTPVQPAAYSITGTVKYYNAAASPLKNVKAVLSSTTASDTVNTNESGNVTFTGLNPGNYTFTLSTEASWEGVNATDALSVLLYMTNSLQLDTVQVLAADVTNDGNITATDALQILRRFSGLINQFNKPDWIFIPASSGITISNSNALFEASAIIAGDVNRSFQP
jgi:peptidoglycan/xylan/chitin deacetylase (PgdA/CDA1 family)